MKKRKIYIGFVELLILIFVVILSIGFVYDINKSNKRITEVYSELELVNIELGKKETTITELKTTLENLNNKIESVQLTLDWQTTQVYNDMDTQINTITDKLRVVSSQRIILSDEELNRFYALVMAEAGGESIECQKAVASTVINRILHNDFPSTFNEVMYQRNAFSVVGDNSLNRYEPTESVITAVQLALYEDFADGALYFLNYELAVQQGYSENANNMINSFEYVVKIDSVTFLK